MSEEPFLGEYRLLDDLSKGKGGFADVYMPFSNHAESVTEGHHRLTEKVTLNFEF